MSRNNVTRTGDHDARYAEVIAKKAPQPAPTLSKDTRIAVLHGPEVFLRTLYTAQLREILEKAHGQIDVFHFDGASAPIADVLDECRSFGLMAQAKLVIVDNADQLVKEANRALMERYAENPPEGSTLVLRSDKWHKGKLDALVSEVGAIIACEPLPDSQAIAWAVERCKKRHGASIERDAAELLIERIGGDLGRIDSELAKLAAAAGDAKSINAQLTAQFVGPSREQEVWSIQSTLLTGDAPAVLTHLRDVVDVSRQPPTLVSYAFIDLARKLHGMSAALRQGANPFQLARPLKLWGPTLETVAAAGRQADPSDAASLLAACVRADSRQKSGFGSPERSLEVIALRFAWLNGSRRR